ncbi:MAG: hypothetical protein LBQ88_03495 [Treponema sp.]|jgi:ABC-type glycerol-3-phosphate transport system substrate-binding protein|nr:hypothetical protein [Treponema sp.]
MAYPVLGRPEFDGIYVRPAQYWSIANASKNQVLAAKLLNFIINDAAAITALELYRSAHPTEKGQKILADLGILQGPAYVSTSYLMQTAASPYSAFILIPEVLEILRNEYSRFITGGATAEAAGKTIYNEWQRVLTNLRRSSGL